MFATVRAISRPPGDYAQRQLLGLGTVIDTLTTGIDCAVGAILFGENTFKLLR